MVVEVVLLELFNDACILQLRLMFVRFMLLYLVFKAFHFFRQTLNTAHFVM